MTWRFVGAEQGKQPIPGIPLESEDDVFEEAVQRYEARFGPYAKGSVKRTGLYKQDKKSPAPAEEDN